MAEQDRLDEVLGDRATVDGHERFAGAGRGALDAAGDNFLADAAFTEDEHGNIGRCRTFGEADHLAHRCCRGNHVVETHAAFGLARQAFHLAGQRLHLEGVADGDNHALRIGGLDDEVHGAAAHRLDDRVDTACRGQHDDRQVGTLVRQALQRVEARKARHGQVEQHHVDAVLGIGSHGNPGFAVRRRAAGKARFLHGSLQQAPLCRIVINYQNGLRHHLTLVRGRRVCLAHRAGIHWRNMEQQRPVSRRPVMTQRDEVPVYAIDEISGEFLGRRLSAAKAPPPPAGQSRPRPAAG